MISASKDLINRWVLWLGGGIFFLCLIAFVLTGEYLIFAIPFGLSVLALAILDFKGLYWFFLLTIPFSFSIYFFHRSLSTTLPDEPLAWLFLIITLLTLAFNRKLFPKWFFKDPLVLLITLQVVWMIVATLFSTDLFPSVKYVISKLWFLNVYLLIPVFIFKKAEDFKKAFFLLVIPITLHALFVFAWHYKMKFGYSESNDVVFPFYQNHVDYSTVISMIFPLLFTGWILSKGNKLWRCVFALTMLFYLPAIYVAQARAAILAILFAFLIYFMIRMKWVKIVMPLAYTFILVGVLAISYNNYYFKYRPSSSTATQKTFADTVAGMFKGKDMSSMERVYRWIAAIRLSHDHPITGVGPNNFYENYKPYTVSIFATWVSRNKERSTTHDYFLFMLVEQGWPAMILYGLLIALVFAKAQKIYHRTDDRFYKHLAIGLAMTFAAGFVNNFFSELIDTHKVGAFFYLTIASLIILDHLTKEEKLSEKGSNPLPIPGSDEIQPD